MKMKNKDQEREVTFKLDPDKKPKEIDVDFDGAQVVLTDLGSTNGTMVNGQRVSAVALNPGDMIQIGTTTLTFRVYG